MGPIIAVKDELFKTFRLACLALQSWLLEDLQWKVCCND